MRVTSRRCLLAVAVGVLLAPAVASASSSVKPLAAARACAEGGSIRTPFPASDAADLGGFVSCLLRRERAQLGLNYTQSPAVSAMVESDLGSMEKLPYGKEHRLKAVTRSDIRAAVRIYTRACGRASSPWGITFGATLGPPPLTPLTVAALVVGWFRGRSAGTTTHAVFGVASRPGRVFYGGDPRGASFGAVVVDCA